LDTLLALSPNDPRALVHRGELKSLQGKQDAAIADFDAALATGSAADAGLAKAARGRAYLALKNFPAAVKDLEEGLKLRPDLTWAPPLLAEAKAKLAKP
jgi:tetratricopeptide (TPR) repeat protein